MSEALRAELLGLAELLDESDDKDETASIWLVSLPEELKYEVEQINFNFYH